MGQVKILYGVEVGGFLRLGAEKAGRGCRIVSNAVFAFGASTPKESIVLHHLALEILSFVRLAGAFLNEPISADPVKIFIIVHQAQVSSNTGWIPGENELAIL